MGIMDKEIERKLIEKIRTVKNDDTYIRGLLLNLSYDEDRLEVIKHIEEHPQITPKQLCYMTINIDIERGGDND